MTIHEEGDQEHRDKDESIQLMQFAGPILFGAFEGKCGAKAKVWRSTNPVPISILIIVNIGICSLDVSVNGAPVRQIPGRARRPEMVVSSGVTSIDVRCVLNVPGGDCDYFFFLITL